MHMRAVSGVVGKSSKKSWKLHFARAASTTKALAPRSSGASLVLLVAASAVERSPPALTLNKNQPSLTSVLNDLVEGVNQIYRNARAATAEQSKSRGSEAILNITAVNVSVFIMWRIMPTSFMIR